MGKITEPAKLKAATTYNAAADHFDDGPLAFWDRYGRETIERLHLKPGSIVLDVGCGSGASAIPAAKAAAPQPHRRGFARCIAARHPATRRSGRAKADSAAISHVRFTPESGHGISWAIRKRFDAVVCVFAIFFVADMVSRSVNCRPWCGLAANSRSRPGDPAC